jgi:hypothetical protein
LGLRHLEPLRSGLELATKCTYRKGPIAKVRTLGEHLSKLIDIAVREWRVDRLEVPSRLRTHLNRWIMESRTNYRPSVVIGKAVFDEQYPIKEFLDMVIPDRNVFHIIFGLKG